MKDLFNKHNCKYKEMFNNNHTPMLIIDAKTGNIDDANLAACSYYGYIRDKLLKMNIADINVLKEEEVEEEIEKAKKEERKFFQFKHKLSNGEIRNVEVYTGPIKLGNKELLFSIIHDSQERVELESKYKKNKAYFDNLFHNSPEAIAIVDRDYRVLEINNRFEDVFQYNLKDIREKDLTELLCDETLYEASHNFRESIRRGKFIKEEVKRRRKDGKLLDVLLLGFPLVIEGETIGAYCIYSDIREAKEREKKIELLTKCDVLTGLFNRDFFLSNLDYEILKNKRENRLDEKIVVIILCINEFKEIMEALGPLAADNILKEFALRLKEGVGPEDIVARFGEDEFAILIPKIKDMDKLNGLTGEIIECLNMPFYIDANEIKITTSGGISIYPDNSIETIALVRKAEIAMNKSKELNSNMPIKFQNSLDKEVQEYFWIKNSLTRALPNKELFLNYQPIYDTSVNRLVGVEALIRWEHKEMGIIPPAKFIPIAERTGLIHPIGDWVLLNACKQNKKWQDLGYEPIYISVNISALQLEKPGFIKVIERTLEESQLEPKYLQLEITETFFAHKYEYVEDTIGELNELGVKLAIDDFGTGYSSLGQLCQFSINSIKIDRSLISDVHKKSNKNKVVKAVISLAKSLNIDLIAEGVETQEELRFLKENRCTVAQGFLFSKPVRAEKIEKSFQKTIRNLYKKYKD
ncbi:putative Diguanylate cyclase [[Clostridium] ultunense Esp]|uniref:Putative Diguanylate cyclase n=1 Tax=[Clostridium] ultunense Esp TaxID=1288971 RepID=M1ZLN2_9FIRM|nr:bifunctional diguanylate cyclase/phosphodiesterase [Schnuerera ultunensis]CCQ97497.1 putative Diguanylate cyclase [[Clostridium] ultunense Esp]SHD76105.1 putative Diguanylate cyclase [[Clostridium] ultunense Esp]